jgi:hypothetical protein
VREQQEPMPIREWVHALVVVAVVVAVVLAAIVGDGVWLLRTVAPGCGCTTAPI